MVNQILPATVWPNPVAARDWIARGLIVSGLVGELAVLNLGIDDLDEGYFAQQAVRVLHGQVPFRDFETLYSPGLLYLHAALFAATGGPSLLAMRALSLVGRAAMAVLLFELARPIIRNPVWAAAPALVLLLGLDDAPVFWEPHPAWLSTAFALAAVWCIARGAQRKKWLVAAGVAAGASYAFKQNTGAFTLAAILLWSGRRAFLPPLLAFVAVTLAWLLPLVVALGGQLGPLAVLVGEVHQAGLFAPPEPTILLPVACLVAAAWLTRHDTDGRLRWYTLAGSALLLTEYPRMDTSHLAWSAPLLLVVGAIALSRLPARITVSAVVAVVVLLAPTWSSRLASLTVRRAEVAEVEAPVETAAYVQSTLDDIEQRTAPGEPIFVYPTSPLLYALADRPNPTRFDHLNPGAADARQVDQIIADLSTWHVQLAVISDYWRGAWGDPRDNLELEDWLGANYSEVARHGPYRILAARSASLGGRLRL